MAELSTHASLTPLLERAARAPFFELVRALEQLFPERAAPGALGPYETELVHFSNAADLTFATADVQRVALAASGSHVDVTTTFLGVTGASTPLPLYLAEEIAQDDPGESERARFLDLFHHRLLGLLYRALADLSHPHSFERGRRDVISDCVASLSGRLETDDRQDDFRRRVHLRYASLLLSHPGSADALEVSLSDALRDELAGRARVRVICFVGEHVPLAWDAQSRLGANTRLGDSFLLGARVRDRASKLRVCIGPLDAGGYQSLLPGQPAFARARALIDLMLREPLSYELEYELEAGSARGFRLGSDQLGRMTWLGASPAGARVRVACPSRARCV